jgi:hypothetical protein
MMLGTMSFGTKWVKSWGIWKTVDGEIFFPITNLAYVDIDSDDNSIAMTITYRPTTME